MKRFHTFNYLRLEKVVRYNLNAINGRNVYEGLGKILKYNSARKFGESLFNRKRLVSKATSNINKYGVTLEVT
jgi:hypothetical protein